MACTSSTAMLYREATYGDAVATIHAESWRVAYRGALRNEFLDGDIVQDRMRVWGERLAAPATFYERLGATDRDGDVWVKRRRSRKAW